MATLSRSNLSELENRDEFIGRHLSLNIRDINAMLSEVNADSLDDLTAQIVPEAFCASHFYKWAMPFQKAKHWLT